jgi:hypothetical protein
MKIRRQMSRERHRLVDNSGSIAKFKWRAQPAAADALRKKFRQSSNRS